jgi:hypothetical protein
MLLGLTLGFAACGKKSAPIPPQLVVPESPGSLLVRNVADGLEITFKRPRRYVSGIALDDLASFEIFRSCDADPGFGLIANVPVVDRDRFQKQTSFTLTDYAPTMGQVCLYRVVTVTLDDYRSAAAESQPIRREPPPSPTPSPVATPAARWSPSTAPPRAP